MGQPKFAVASNLTICTFGNAALPNGQGTLSNINLNDAVNWFLQDFQSDDDMRQIGLAQLLYRAKGTYISDDFGARTIGLPMRYLEDGTHFLGGALAQLSQAGEQQLSFDASTFILCKYKGIRSRTLVRKYSPFLWEFTLDFVAKTPWFQDNASTSISSVNIVNAPTTAPTLTDGGAAATPLHAGAFTVAYTYVTSSGETKLGPTGAVTLTSTGDKIHVAAISGVPSWVTSAKFYFVTQPASDTTGFTVTQTPSAGTIAAFDITVEGSGTLAPASTPATSFSVTYPGSVFAEPVFTLTVPNTNAAAISSLILKNTMSGENLTVTFTSVAAIPASTSDTVTIDCGAFTATDTLGKNYDISGSFPQIYPPINQSNTYTAAVTTVSGTASGLTLAGSFTNRWQI